MISYTKQYLINWWLLVFISFLLWYRNRDYDRIIAVFTFVVAIIDLLQYGVFSGMSEKEAGKSIYIALWAQILVLAIATHVYVKEGISMIYFIVMAIVSSIFIIYGMMCNGDKLIANCQGWFNDDNPNILGVWWWVYLLGLFIPVLLIAYYKNASILTLIFYAIGISIYVICSCSEMSFWGPSWFLLATGFAFITWLLVPVCETLCL